MNGRGRRAARRKKSVTASLAKGIEKGKGKISITTTGKRERGEVGLTIPRKKGGSRNALGPKKKKESPCRKKKRGKRIDP